MGGGREGEAQNPETLVLPQPAIYTYTTSATHSMQGNGRSPTNGNERETPSERSKLFGANASELEERTILSSFRGGDAATLNDNAKGIDRFGYLVYAQALYFILNRASPPVCVGLFAKWGSGKSFMMHLLKQQFDPTCEEDSSTYELIQWFDPRYTSPHPNAKNWPVVADSLRNRCSIRCQIISKWLGTDSSSLSYSTLAWFLLMKDLFEEFCQDVQMFYSGGAQLLPTSSSEDEITPSSSFSSSKISPKDTQDEEKGNGNGNGNGGIKKSYIFVDFNAWEFNKSDQLWVALIRNIYSAVERRMKAYRDDKGVPIDFKRLWRAQKAKEVVIRSYGGIKALRFRILLLIFCCFILLVCVVLALYYLRELIHFFRSHRSGGVASILTFLLFFVGTIYPIIEMVFKTGKESNTSQGDRIYSQAADGQDKIGFLRHVREELDELFTFLVETYQEKTGEALTLVIFIDDLDRCVGEGRIVVVLEALQLLLNIPGAPVIAFLAVDSRIIASSIEATLDTSLNLQDTPVTGWEYLDKLIQVPFCLPSPPPQKIERMLTSSLAGSDIAVHVIANRLRNLIIQLQVRYEKRISDATPFIGFLEEGDEFKRSRYHRVSQFISSLELFKEDDETLVLHAATSVLSKYAANVVAKSSGLNKEERLELICRSVDFCLCHFDFVSEEMLRYQSRNETTHVRSTTKLENWQAATEESPEISAVDADLQEFKSLFLSYSPRPHLVRSNALTALKEISLYLDPNPRKLKHLANILQLVTAVADCKPVSEVNSDRYLSDEPGWEVFMVKIVKWIGLCECYPFRTSLLVQILEDMDQKVTYAVRNPNGMLHYEGVSSIDFENMTLVEFYYKFVARLIHCIPEFKKLNRLDADAELFVSYLTLPLSGLPDNREILASDVLGPIINSKKRFRDLNFSLLSHSFNLNPAMRSVISLEVQNIEPDYPLSLRVSP